MDDGSAQPRLTIDSPVRLHQETKVTARRAPDIGEHTDQILRELGFDTDPITSLRGARAIPPGHQRGKAA